ncbi:MAG: 3-phosphoshikimate 1-carboxyvinyltransferase [Spirochaetales bacterium]|nr:3-phosphoshikimate 1-carboxyvinyltransferase [Spirochaetales bacterium]
MEATGGRAVLALIGLPASGKSTVGALVAGALGAAFADSDAEIGRAAGRAVAELFRSEGEAAFRQRELACVGELTRSPAAGASAHFSPSPDSGPRGGRWPRLVLALGGGAPTVESIRELLRERCVVAWLDLAPEVAAARARADGESRPLLARDPEGGMRALDAGRRAIYAACADFRVDADASPEAVAARLLERLSGGVDVETALPGRVAGAVAAPPSKSSAIRALACALYADGESLVRGAGYSDDVEAAARACRTLGARVEREGPDFRVSPARLRGAARGAVSVDCGESALVLRMFAALAALSGDEASLEARGSLRGRPAGMVEAALGTYGAACASSGGAPPLRVRGPLRAGDARIDGSESSQAVSGLLLALALTEGDSTLEVERAVSGGYVDLTLETLRAFDLRIDGDRTEGGARRFRIPGGQTPRGREFRVEGDWSGAAFMLVAGAIAGPLPGEGGAAGFRVTGLDADSRQPDRAVLEALRLAGAAPRVEGDSVSIARAELRAFRFDASDCPDLFPPLVVLASLCPGVTELRGARRLRAKESDRALALAEEFGKLGAVLELDGDLARVRGGPIRGGRADSRGDHRIAMALAVAALAADGPVAIGGASCAAKSWPGFFAELDRLRAARD